MLPLSAYLGSAIVPPSAFGERQVGDAAAAGTDGRAAAAWFSDTASDASRLLRAPSGASATPASASELTQRFLGCLCEGGAA